MSHSCVKKAAERKVKWEKEETGAGSDNSNNDEMKGSGINKGAKLKKRQKRKSRVAKITKLA